MHCCYLISLSISFCWSHFKLSLARCYHAEFILSKSLSLRGLFLRPGPSSLFGLTKVELSQIPLRLYAESMYSPNSLRASSLNCKYPAVWLMTCPKNLQRYLSCKLTFCCSTVSFQLENIRLKMVSCDAQPSKLFGQ